MGKAEYIQTISVTSCLGGPDRQCGYAAEMLRNEYARSENANFQLHWHMLHPDNKRSDEAQLIRLIKSISRYSSVFFNTNQPYCRKICVLEICEFNPENDANNKTLH